MAITAYGADVVFVPTLEEGRDLACKMQDAGEGVLLDQNNNPANPEAHVTGTGKSGRHIHPPPPRAGATAHMRPHSQHVADQAAGCPPHTQVLRSGSRRGGGSRTWWPAWAPAARSWASGEPMCM
jgi:hypothetical protein